ncbi:toll-like receptor 13 [Branchiostoma floridae]|uniref:Toll-like receptor 13 n=1 Tax=Branchiostoma floridae TaxID=7739 RepID=A0A9J7LHF2_BRAFL|nr:toll-like receptor 13 [Branchiostoma floridae]
MSRPWLLVCFLLGHFAGMNRVSAIRNDAFPCWSLNATFVDCSFLNLDYVPLMPSRTTAVELSHNRIPKLANNSFHGLDNLLQLQLSNNAITSMEKEAFANLQQLEELNLSDNPLVHIHPDAFLPLRSLTKLDLSEVRLTAIPEALRMLYNLQDVNLATNAITSANLDTFRGMSNIQTISILGNFVGNISANDFKVLTNSSLRALSLSATVDSLSHIQKGALTTLRNVQQLDFTDIKVRGMSEFLDYTCELTFGTVKFLRLVYMRLYIYRSGFFDCLPRTIETLNLDLNIIENLPRNLFVRLTNLQVLRMSQCWMSSIEIGAFSGLENLKELHLSGNKLTALDPNVFIPISGSLEVLNLGNNLNFQLQPGHFRNLTLLQILALQNCGIRSFESDHFEGLSNLIQLDIGFNKANYEPTKKGIFKYIQNLEVFLTKENDAFFSLDAILSAGLDSLWVLDLRDGSGNILNDRGRSINIPDLQVLRVTNSIDSGITYAYHYRADLFWNLTLLQELDLSKNGFLDIKKEAFWHLKKLDTLNLAGNYLVSLHPSMFRDAHSLRVLDLSYNRITAISPKLFQNVNSLRQLNMRQNLITSIGPQTLIYWNRLYKLDLSRNQFSCTCQLLDFVEWARNNTSVRIMSDSYTGLEYSYKCFSPPDLKDLPLIDYNPDCKSYLGYYACIVMSTFVFLYTTLTYMLTKYHAYIRYLYQYARGKLRGYQAIPYRNRYEYDVFVSYNNEDIRWVQQELIPHLEEVAPHYRLCIGDRDFLAGRDITTNIVEAIQDSRKTLCLLTQRFVRSGWCTLEFKIAQHRLFEEGKDVLVLVLLEDIPVHVVQRYNRLRQLMSRKTYLVWPEDKQARPLFWVRLRKALGAGNVLPNEEDV